MIKLEAFLPRLLPSVMGCPDSLALQALRDSAIEFCEETHVVQLTTEASSVRHGVATYDIDLPTGTQVCRVLAVWYGASSLQLVAPSVINPTLQLDAANVGTPRAAFISEPLAVTLYPAPDALDGAMLTVRVATKPSRAATNVDDSLWEDWAEAVVAGAAYRLASVPAQPFTSDMLAMRSQATFRYYAIRARVEGSKGRVRTDTSAQMRRFA